MSPTTHRGWFPLRVPAELLDVLPEPLQADHALIVQAHARIEQARQDAADAAKAAASADADDQRAARAAVESGKPIPKPTVETTAATADVKRREVKALEQITADTEDDLLARIEEIRPQIADSLRDRAQAEHDEALAALDAFTHAVRRVSATTSLWKWARSTHPGMPRGSARLEVVLHGVGQAAEDVAAYIAGAITEALPEGIEARERAAQEEQARIMATPQVVPGVVADHAGWQEITA